MTRWWSTRSDRLLTLFSCALPLPISLLLSRQSDALESGSGIARRPALARHGGDGCRLIIARVTSRLLRGVEL